jgi:hypothetical protein
MNEQFGSTSRPRNCWNQMIVDAHLFRITNDQIIWELCQRVDRNIPLPSVVGEEMPIFHFPSENWFEFKRIFRISSINHLECHMMRWISPDLSALRNNSMNHWRLHFTHSPFAAMHRCNLLIHSRKTTSKAWTLILSRIFRTPERNSSADPNCCPWRRFVRCSNQEQEKVRGS